MEGFWGKSCHINRKSYARMNFPRNTPELRGKKNPKTPPKIISKISFL